MGLVKTFVDYTRNAGEPGAAAALARALGERGYDVERSLLESVVARGSSGFWRDVHDGPWDGRRVWSGPDLPADGRAGDLWLDTVEVTPMLLLPWEMAPGETMSPATAARLPAYYAWLALRPVAQWQFRAFLGLAQTGPRDVEIEPPFRLLDPDRILSGPDGAPVTRLTQGEARLYAAWFAKTLPHQVTWQAAAALLPPPLVETLWGWDEREWVAGRPSGDDEGRIAISPSTVHIDPDGDEDDTGGEPRVRMIYEEWATRKTIGFRTCVLLQSGFPPSGEIPASTGNVRLLGRVDRGRWP